MFRCSRVTLSEGYKEVVHTEWPMIVLEEGDPDDPVVLHELFKWHEDSFLYRLVGVDRVYDRAEVRVDAPMGRPISMRWLAVRQDRRLDIDLAAGQKPLISFDGQLLVPSEASSSGAKDTFPVEGNIMIYTAYYCSSNGFYGATGTSGSTGSQPCWTTNRPPRKLNKPPKMGMVEHRYKNYRRLRGNH